MKTKANLNSAGEPMKKEKAKQTALLLRPKEAAEMLCVSRATLWRWCAEGKLPAPVRLGGVIRWRSADLTAWVAAGCVPLDGIRVTG